jgi:putative ABC transport system permease protein
MRAIAKARLLLRSLIRRSEVERNLEEEFRFHLDQLVEENIAAGMKEVEARESALRTIGGISQFEEECRDMRRTNYIDETLLDFRYAGRSLLRNKGFSILAGLIMALGIGANTAVFSLVNQILLHPPGVSEPQRILALRTHYKKLNLDVSSASGPAFADARANRQLFEHVGASRSVNFNYTAQGNPVRLPGAAASAEWFDVFGAKPTLGRVFVAGEDMPNANRVVVLSYDAWVRLYGADPHVLGRTMELNQTPHQIIGVMARGFHQPRAADLWVPLALSARALSPQTWLNENLTVMARTQPTMSFAQANAWLKLASQRVLAIAPANVRSLVVNNQWGMDASRLVDASAGETKAPILILLSAVSLVLLIACANIAGLMLAKTASRSQELSVRAALGAGRGRLLRHIFAESLLLAVAGGAAGLFIGQRSMQMLLRLAPESAGAGLEPHLDFFVLLFAIIATLGAGLLFGLAPAWQSCRVDPYDAVKSGGRTGSAARQRLRSGLVVAETALALVLLVMAGLLLRSFARLEAVNPGFEPHGVMTASYLLPPGYRSPEKQAAFARNLMEHLERANGVIAASLGVPIPFDNDYEGGAFRIEGRNAPSSEALPQAERRWVTPEYFRTLGIRLEKGRLFGDFDRPEAAQVAVIDNKLARQYWPDEDPLGKRIQPTSGEGPYTIVGIVNHIMQADLAGDQGRGVFYVSLYQRPMPLGSILVKTPRDPAAAASIIRDAVRTVDPTLPLFQVKTMDSLLAGSLAPRRFAMRLMSLFAVAALFLAALGLYGVLSYAVTQRTQEIGIRVALGAERATVMKLIVGQGLRLAGIGVAIGIGVAMALARLIESQLFEVPAIDPLTIATMTFILMGAAILASWLPARRAVRTDPIVALRYW